MKATVEQRPLPRLCLVIRTQLKVHQIGESASNWNKCFFAQIFGTNLLLIHFLGEVPF